MQLLHGGLDLYSWSLQCDTSIMTIEEIGKIIREQREVFGLSSDRLADLVGVATSTIKEIESGSRNPTFEMLQSILDAIGLELTVAKKWEAW